MKNWKKSTFTIENMVRSKSHCPKGQSERITIAKQTKQSIICFIYSPF